MMRINGLVKFRANKVLTTQERFEVLKIAAEIEYHLKQNAPQRAS